MSGLDLLLLAALAVGVLLALRSIHRQRRQGGGCCGSCGSCTQHCAKRDVPPQHPDAP